VSARTDWTIDEIVVPATVDAPDAGDFVEAVEVGNAVEEHSIGTRDTGWSPEELLPIWQDPYERRRMVVARLDGRIVGRGTYEVQSGEPRSGWVFADVLPEHRSRGIGTALAERVERMARDEGRTVLQAFALQRMPTGGRVPAPTGFGAAPSDDDGGRFLLHRGYRLTQVERMSRLPLPAEVPALPDAPGYALEFWEGPTPQRFVDDIAVLSARMSTDAPMGEADVEPEEWDAARVRDADERNGRGGRRWITAAARHEASGRLVAFTQLAIPVDPGRPVFQWATLVLEEHRGHRLGMLVKVANLERLTRSAPGHPSVYTWNAEENTHMLRVNDALGFAAVGVASNWRRDL